MRALVITLVMVFTLLTFWGVFLIYTDNSSDELIRYMTDVYEYASEGDWDGALEGCDFFLKKWSRNSKIYALYMEGTCVHDIELSAERCRGYIISQNASLTLGESASILAHIRLMKENERVSLSNVM